MSLKSTAEVSDKKTSLFAGGSHMHPSQETGIPSVGAFGCDKNIL